ncbi:hypothetical protein ASPCAL06870 [Aspergillus calidoustus]|uniref:Uncharacterized protein n=1 Tax=Aspergillus calidoustus TaxID=454130 RepID=A0A0U5G1Y1_ASPCI|nr:hypothetical protein ASPCAL06870 [Aspergillus calidoustus]
MGVSLFYAHVLFHRRLLNPPGPPSKFHDLAVTNIIEMTKKQYESDPRLMRRLHWPILMAAIETKDASHREWLQDRLTDLRQFHSEYLWASEIADEILSRQDASNGIYADVAALLRQRSGR